MRRLPDQDKARTVRGRQYSTGPRFRSSACRLPADVVWYQERQVAGGLLSGARGHRSDRVDGDERRDSDFIGIRCNSRFVRIRDRKMGWRLKRRCREESLGRMRLNVSHQLSFVRRKRIGTGDPGPSPVAPETGPLTSMSLCLWAASAGD